MIFLSVEVCLDLPKSQDVFTLTEWAKLHKKNNWDLVKLDKENWILRKNYARNE